MNKRTGPSIICRRGSSGDLLVQTKLTCHHGVAWNMSRVPSSLWASGRGPRSIAQPHHSNGSSFHLRRPWRLHQPKKWVRETACPVRRLCGVPGGSSHRSVSRRLGAQEEPRGPDRQGAYLASAVGTSERQIPAPGRERSSQVGGGGSWQTPAALGLLPQILGAVREQPGQASRRPGGS